MQRPALLDIDVFCRVIDNYGDIGVCWRLCRDAAERGHRVRLWVDAASALAWMAPPPRPAGLALHHWDEAEAGFTCGDGAQLIIEAFGCELPVPVLRRMAAATRPPHWINLEYLSAESYVERSHGLPSPRMSEPGRGLLKHFFYPGFTSRTGGLLREPHLLQAIESFDADAWLARQGWARQAGERAISLFCYPHAPLASLLQALQDEDTLLLLCAGPAQRAAMDQVNDAGWLARCTRRADGSPRLRCIAVPRLSQDDYDRLLWACDLNIVRGEDSFVRAQWAAKPFVWHIYAQDDDVHEAKLQAFLTIWQQGEAPMAPSQAPAWQQLWQAFNQPAASADALRLPPLPPAREHARLWRAHLTQQPDLLSQLLGFIGD